MTDPKYDRQRLCGDDVTLQEQELLVRLMEEAGEVIQACAKTLRWGWRSVNPTLPASEQETNGKYVQREVRDLITLATRLGILDNRTPAPQEDTRDGGECIWTRDEFGDPDFYETSCGQAFTFNEGTASDNGVKFCHHCGKPMREVKMNTDEDDSEEDEAVIIDAALLSNPSGEQHDAT